jgi:hypothetical protein
MPRLTTYLVRSPLANVVVHATRLPFDPGSLERLLRPFGASYVEELWSPILTACRPEIARRSNTYS